MITFKETYGVVSPVNDLPSDGSMSEVTLHGGKKVGAGKNVVIDGRGGSVVDIGFFETFFANSGGNPTGISVLGTVNTLTVVGSRYELIQPSGEMSFVRHSPGSLLVAPSLIGVNCADGIAGCVLVRK